MGDVEVYRLKIERKGCNRNRMKKSQEKGDLIGIKLEFVM